MLGPEFPRKAFRLDPLLSIEELAEYLGVPITTIYDWRVDGKGPCGVRVGRHVKFTVSDVLAWIDEQRDLGPGSIPMGGDLRWGTDGPGPLLGPSVASPSSRPRTAR